MAKLQSLAIVAALCFLSSLSVIYANHFIVEGKVYCDTCRAGFETFATYYIPAAKVKLDCTNRTTHLKTFEGEGLTDATGAYQVEVTGDHEDDVCDVSLVSSPVKGCDEVVPGRNKARISLTKNNGIISDIRFANPLGFYKNDPLHICPKVLEHYNG
ncbi:pollen allergen Che a 1-like [Aristolochia californica]|uniref:pollen allergen Che a 1-like n=1 Tax=Aristolochia californica TaxID=171875 RepID=UPI0035DAB395